MKANVTWQDGLSFTGTADTGFSISLGASPAVGGADDGFRPMELLLLGLAGCTGLDVISILQKKRQDVTDFRVEAEAESASEHPHVFTHVRLHYVISGPAVDAKAVERAIELSRDKYCPASAMLSQATAIEYTYDIEAATGVEA